MELSAHPVNISTQHMATTLTPAVLLAAVVTIPTLTMLLLVLLVLLVPTISTMVPVLVSHAPLVPFKV